MESALMCHCYHQMLSIYVVMDYDDRKVSNCTGPVHVIYVEITKGLA